MPKDRQQDHNAAWETDYQPNRLQVRLGTPINKLLGDRAGTSQNGTSSF